MSETQMALLFPYIPFLGLLLAFLFVDLINGNDDDDDQDGGKGIRVDQNQPLYAPAGA